jgi:hypothetical protein
MSIHPIPAGPSLPAGPAPSADATHSADATLSAGAALPAGPTLPAAGPETRASDADRDAAVGLLNEAFAEGRLTADEHGQRLSAAYAARSWQQLHQLTADLPDASGAAAVPMAHRMAAGMDPCLLCVLLIVCPPAGIAYWLLSRRRPQALPAGERGRAALHAQDR